MPRRSREAAAQTRATVLDRATALGSVEGLEALSIGRLADAASLSKSGVTRHFASKRELQLAAVDVAAQRFTAAVTERRTGTRPGLERLRASMELWISYLERDPFPGGCFLTAASLEYDGRPGAVRDAVADLWRLWLELLERDAERAQAQGELPADPPARQLVFQLHAYATEANWARQLFGDPQAFDHARAAVARVLGS